MSYMYENNERYTIRLIVEDPKLIKRINPWWFFDEIPKHIAWGIYNAEKNHLDWSLETIHEILEDRNIDKNMIDKYLEIDLPDPSIVNNIIDYFIISSQIFEIAEKDLNKSILSKKEYQTLRAISEKLKVYKWNDAVISYINEMYVKVTNDRKSKEDAIRRKRLKLSRRFE